MNLKSNAIALIARGAEALKKEGNDSTAYALYTLANNLILLMRKDVSIKQWLDAYSGEDQELFEVEELVPVKD